MKKFLLALLTAVTAAALFCGAAASVATYSASYDAPAGINTIVVQDSSAAVILQAADIDHIRADYTYTLRCTEGSSPIVPLFPTTEFYNSAVTVVTYSLQPL